MKVLSLCSLTGLEPSVMKFDGLLVIHKNYNKKTSNQNLRTSDPEGPASSKPATEQRQGIYQYPHSFQLESHIKYQ